MYYIYIMPLFGKSVSPKTLNNGNYLYTGGTDLPAGVANLPPKNPL